MNEQGRRLEQAINALENVTLKAGENHIGSVGGNSGNPSATFTRPADVTQYTSGDLIANSTTAGSVVALEFTNAARVEAGSLVVRRARLHKDNATLTAATFRLHIFKTDPVGTAPSGGDNAAIELNSLAAGSYMGWFDFDFTGTVGDIQSSDIEMQSIPNTGTDMTIELSAGTSVYGLLTAQDTYMPASAEVIYCELETFKD